MALSLLNIAIDFSLYTVESTAHSLLSDRFDIHTEARLFQLHRSSDLSLLLLFVLFIVFPFFSLYSGFVPLLSKVLHKRGFTLTLDPLPLLLCLLLLRNLFSFDVLGSLVPALANFLPTQALHWRLSLVGGGLDLFSSRQLSSQSWQAAPKSLDTTEHSTRTLDRKKNIGNTGMCPRNTSFAATN